MIHTEHPWLWYAEERLDSWTCCISQNQNTISPVQTCLRNDNKSNLVLCIRSQAALEARVRNNSGLFLIRCALRGNHIFKGKELEKYSCLKTKEIQFPFCFDLANGHEIGASLWSRWARNRRSSSLKYDESKIVESISTSALSWKQGSLQEDKKARREDTPSSSHFWEKIQMKKNMAMISRDQAECTVWRRRLLGGIIPCASSWITILADEVQFNNRTKRGSKNIRKAPNTSTCAKVDSQELVASAAAAFAAAASTLGNGKILNGKTLVGKITNGMIIPGKVENGAQAWA